MIVGFWTRRKEVTSHIDLLTLTNGTLKEKLRSARNGAAIAQAEAARQTHWLQQMATTLAQHDLPMPDEVRARYVRVNLMPTPLRTQPGIPKEQAYRRRTDVEERDEWTRVHEASRRNEDGFNFGAAALAYAAMSGTPSDPPAPSPQAAGRFESGGDGNFGGGGSTGSWGDSGGGSDSGSSGGDSSGSSSD